MVDVLLTPNEIDESFVARPVADIAEVVVGTEAVLVGEGGRATVLNPTGALIWACFDGESTLGELVTELSEEVGAPRDVVRADVLAFAQVLGEAGMLEGVGYPPPEIDWDADQPTWEPPVALEVGDELADFTAVDFDGEEHHLTEFRGQDLLLVNWSPGCGYCTTIADRLGVWSGALGDEGVQLVFVTRGDADANRAVFDGAGLDAPALVRTEGDDPFVGYGTPSAYHVDAEGRLAAPMALGAFDVPILAASLAGVDPDAAIDVVVPDAPLDDEPSDPVPEGTRYLPVAGGMCGPGGGAAAGSSSTEWLGTRAYRIADYHVGIRYNSDATAEVLDALFDGARVRDRRAQDSYSVALYDGQDGGASRSLDLLVQNGQQLVRSRSAARVLRALLWRLSADVLEFDTASPRVRVAATAALRGDDALLLPPGLHRWAQQLQPRFARVGIALADVPYPEVDLDSGELVIPVPAVPHAAEVLDRVDDGVRLGSEPAPVLPGRYPLAAWFLGRPPDDADELTPAVATVAALALTHDTDDVPARVAELAALFTRVRGVGLSYSSEAELVDAVHAALD